MNHWEGKALTVVDVLGDMLDLDGRDMAREVVGGDDDKRIRDGKFDGPGGSIKVESEELLPHVDLPELSGLVSGCGDKAHRVTGDAAGPNNAFVAPTGAKAVVVVNVPDRGGVVLGAGEEQVPL